MREILEDYFGAVLIAVFGLIVFIVASIMFLLGAEATRKNYQNCIDLGVEEQTCYDRYLN